MNENENKWRIISYIFTVIFLISLLTLLIYYFYTDKKDPSKGNISAEITTLSKENETLVSNNKDEVDKPVSTPQPSFTDEVDDLKTLQDNDNTSSEEKQTNSGGNKYLSTGLTIDYFFSKYNAALIEDEDYQIKNIELILEEDYYTFKNLFPNEEVLTGIVDKHNNVLYIEYKFPAKYTSDKDLDYIRRMVCVASIVAYTINNETNDIVTLEKSTSILKQLCILNGDEKIKKEYLDEKLLVSVNGGIRYTSQLNKDTNTTCFTLSADKADE